ncbi:MAG TPA: hypothetical protein VF169_17520 [Albitalea sp.]|uniref:hypothetical protein n=1 Tax=Piscinibacter sp. TaxID=1903157 RepID=UPI002ED2FE9A
MANKDVAVPIVFPDYLITVDTPDVEVAVPDALPWVDILPSKIKLPRTHQKLPLLGHAGILFIDGRSGLTRYYEYGRYDTAATGLVRKQQIPDVVMGVGGRPAAGSLKEVLVAISKRSGQSGAIKGAYIELPSGAFDKMEAHALGRMKQNADPKRVPYDLLTNSCLHFMKAVAEAGGASMPFIIAPQPAGYIVQVRLQKRELDYEPTGTIVIEATPLP